MTPEPLIEQLLAGDRTRNVGGPRLSPDFLRDLVSFARRYARVEKMVLGATRVAYSPSALGLDLALDGDLVRQAERLAETERERFELPPGPILGIDRLIEDQGIKVVPRAFPAGTAARGGFFFDSHLGPVVFHDAAATQAQRDYIIAHQYGHFLADYDPYLHTICGHPGPELVDDAREVRAHQFALAFLMPRADVATYRSACGLAPGSPVPREFVQQLQVYFAVDNEIVLWRLLSLGAIDAAGIEALLARDGGLLPEIDLEQTDTDPRLVLDEPTPERFVHLVASAFGRGLLDVPGAAEILDVDEAEAQRILGQFHYEDEPAGGSKTARRQPRVAPPSLN